jgi:GMP synthase (glutamine-hydrolysing)
VTIKSHHNVGGLPERMNMQLVEPLRELFKDEVRVLGRELGLPEQLHRPSSVPRSRALPSAAPAASPARSSTSCARPMRSISTRSARPVSTTRSGRPFAVLLPVQTVGVMGDGRTYEFVCALRAVTSVDGMTADFYPYDMDFLGKTATRIINEVKGINRVVYDVTSKPPGTIEWE